MARIITIANNKGGVGKTTTAVSLAVALRNRGYDVLIIDYDGQANVTDTLRVPTDGGTTYDALKGRTTPYVKPARIMTPGEGAGVLDVLPSCIDLSALETELSNQPDRVTRFSTVTEKYADKYDAVIVDTPPTLGLLTISALYAADDVIIAVQPQYLAVKGLLTLNGTIETVRANRGGEKFHVYVLFAQYDRRKGLHRLTVEQVTAAGFRAFDTKIRENVALAEAPAAGLDIFRYAPRSNGARDYDDLTTEYLAARKLRHLNHKYK